MKLLLRRRTSLVNAVAPAGDMEHLAAPDAPGRWLHIAGVRTYPRRAPGQADVLAR